MKPYLLVGDLHVVPDCIEECRKLILWIVEQKKIHNAVVVLMGDQTDTHGNVRVEVLEFWTWALAQLGSDTIVLTGNHDMNYACTDSSMTPFEQTAEVVGKTPVWVGDQSQRVWAVGYIKDSKEFVSLMNQIPEAKFVFCHQEFNGAQYESGFYAPNGVMPSDMHSDTVFISGHIHKRQVLCPTVFYVGTPRQISKSDDDPDKSIFLFLPDHVCFTPIRVPDEVVSRFQRVTLTEGVELPAIPVPAKAYIDVTGSDEFIKKALRAIPDGCKVRTYPLRIAKQSAVKESEGIGKAFAKYSGTYFDTEKLNTETAAKVMDKIKTLCPSLF